MKRISIIFIVIACSVSMLAQSYNPGKEEFEKCNNLYKKYGICDSVIFYLKKAAEAGHVKAQYSLGMKYRNGNGVPQDNQKGFYWILKSANQGYDKAMNSAGYMYRHGIGVTKDMGKALEWFKKAAEQGDGLYQANLANTYHHIGDYTNAFIWYSKIKIFNPEARMMLGTYYFYGRGVEKDYTKALEYFTKSSETKYSQYYLGLMYENGYGVEKNYTEALNWYEKSAKQETAEAQYRIGLMYNNGYGVEKNYTEAAIWYEKSAKQGYASAQNNLGYLYQYGRGVPEDKTKAKDLYLKAANAGNKAAMSNLAGLYSRMNDDANAFIWYSKAAEDDKNSWAMYVKGFMYYEGRGTEKDLGKAFECFMKSSTDICSQLYLGKMYENGEYVEKDYSKAIEWYEKMGGSTGEYLAKIVKKKMAAESGQVAEDYDMARQSSNQQPVNQQPMMGSIGEGYGGLTGDDIYYHNIMRQATLQSISPNMYPDGCYVNLLPEVEEFMNRADKTCSVNGVVYIDSGGNPVGGDSGSISSSKTTTSHVDESRIKKDAKAVTDAIISAEKNPTGPSLSRMNNYIHNFEKRNGGK